MLPQVLPRMSHMTNKPCAEIIESSLTEWLAQSWQWNQFPSFGSLITIETKKRTLFGIVHHIQTGSMDPGRYPFPYQKTHEELMVEQPQIFEFLKTTFSSLVLGYQEKGKIYYQWPPEPPLIHSFVSNASPELEREFFSSAAYLALLFGHANKITNLDELLLAIIKKQAANNNLNEEKLARIIQDYSLLTGNDYRRLKLFAQRVQQIIQ